MPGMAAVGDAVSALAVASPRAVERVSSRAQVRIGRTPRDVRRVAGTAPHGTRDTAPTDEHRSGADEPPAAPSRPGRVHGDGPGPQPSPSPRARVSLHGTRLARLGERGVSGGSTFVPRRCGPGRPYAAEERQRPDPQGHQAADTAHHREERLPADPRSRGDAAEHHREDGGDRGQPDPLEPRATRAGLGRTGLGRTASPAVGSWPDVTASLADSGSSGRRRSVPRPHRHDRPARR